MVENQKDPNSTPDPLTAVKGKPPRVTATTSPDDPADVQATKALIDHYSDKDGFHCPCCHITITNYSQAIYHLEKEINDAFAKLGK